jgi:hypothetical protein
MKIRGVVRAGTILLEEPLQGLEGRIVSLDLQPVSTDEPSASAAELEAAWRDWSTAPETGPV